MRIFGICGKSKGGRSELVSELVARLRLDGFGVAIVKRAPVSFDMDSPGTDSHRQRDSGCTQMVIASDRRMALMEEYPSDSTPPDLSELVGRLKPVDIVLAINFRDAEIPRLEVFDDQTDANHTARNPRWMFGRVMRSPDSGKPISFGLDDHDAIAAFVLARARRWAEAGPGIPRMTRPAKT